MVGPHSTHWSEDDLAATAEMLCRNHGARAPFLANARATMFAALAEVEDAARWRDLARRCTAIVDAARSV